MPQRNLGPHEERYSRLEALGHLDGAIRCYSCKRRSAIGNCHFAPKLLDRADAIEVLSACQGPQIQRCRKLAVHNCLALAPDEPNVISGALDRGRSIGLGSVNESAACGTTTDGQARSEELAARNHGCPPDCPAYRIGTPRRSVAVPKFWTLLEAQRTCGKAVGDVGPKRLTRSGHRAASHVAVAKPVQPYSKHSV